MFETVAPQLAARPSRKIFYEALPFSIAVHCAIGAAALLGSIWNVAFPLQSPAQAFSFNIAELPSPPPPPPPPPPPAKEQPELLPPARELKVDEIVAPTVIPEVIPVAQHEIVQTAADGVDDLDGGSNGAGIFGGVAGGVLGGEVGGILGGVVGSQVQIERDRPLPMRALSQVYPIYPEKARRQYLEDELIVRYIIGKNGRVREVIVLSPPRNEIFVDATVRAIRNWRFRPLVKDGERQEVVHELTVYYRLEPRA
jgi:protein TonB